jgi:hypothetical protein
MLLLALLWAGVVGAQDFRAKLTVTVTDPSGAAIPGATLALRDIATQEVFPARTSTTGSYSFLFLQPATYTLTVTAQGFRSAARENIVLQSYQASGIDVKLEVGETSQDITVTAETALLATESASRGTTVDSQLVTDLPVPNHNPVMLGQTLAGVYMRPLGAYTDPWTVTSQFMINGGIMYLNEFQLDGAPNNAQMGGNTYGYTPPNEAVQEVSVQANSYDAQYGHTGGGVINLSTKAGGSQFHASAWTYLKRTGWNADSFQNNAVGAPRTPAPQTQWGLQVAGPAKIPHLIPHNDRFQMFYLFSWDKYSELLPNALILSYPTAAMRSGDFSKLADATGSPITIYDPTTGATNSAGKFVRMPFANNIIPSSRINPVSAAVAALMPATNATTPGVRYGIQDLLLPANVHHWDFYNWLSRVDLNLGSKYRIFVRPAHMLFDELSNYNGIFGPGDSGGVFSRSSYALLVDTVATLSPTLIANLRGSATRFTPIWKSPQNQGYDLTKLGLPASFVSQLEQPALIGSWNFDGYTSLGRTISVEHSDTYSLEGSVTKFVRSHSLRAGFDVRLTHFITYLPGNAFSFTSSYNATQALWNDSSSQAYSGDSFASFLLGTPSSGSANWNPALFYTTWYMAPWFQDDWKVNRRLTLNFGLRYDINLGPVESHNRMNAGFDEHLANPVSQQLSSAVLAAYPYLSNLQGAVTFAGVNGASTHPFTYDWNNIQPRFGLAYKIRDRLVFRGGYGLFYSNFQNNNMLNTLGFSSTTSLVVSNNSSQTFLPNVLSNPFPGGITQPTGSSLGSLTSVGQAVTLWNPWYKVPRSHQFSAGFQYQLAKNSVIEAAYVGNRTANLGAPRDINAPAYSFVKQCDEMEGGKMSICNGTVPNPFQGVAAFVGTNWYTSSTITAFNAARPYHEFLGITRTGTDTGYMWYNGLQLSFNQRLTKGLMLNVNYVRSRQLYQYGWMSIYQNIPQRSPYDFDHPNVLKFSAAYTLPLGKGQLINFRNSSVANAVLGGWQLSPTMMAQNGERADLPANAVRLRNSHVQNINWNQYQVRGWGNCVLNEDANGNITPMAYSLKAGCSATDFSNYDWLTVQTLAGQQVSPNGAGDIRMKPYILANLALSKDFRFHERLRVRLRAEATNVLNRFNLLTARFNSDPTSANFGTVMPASTASLDCPPRVIQIGAKVNW